MAFRNVMVESPARISVKNNQLLIFTDREYRREASQFRKFLLNDGYHMIQFSVYAASATGLTPSASTKPG